MRCWASSWPAGFRPAPRQDHRGYIVDQALLDSVAPGLDNQAAVERTLGRPTFVSQYGQRTGTTFRPTPVRWPLAVPARTSS
ncbi:MAG: outer membrane protein assembly factor BamE [Novosphingobium sp.]